jgi:hypothetical protein
MIIGPQLSPALDQKLGEHTFSVLSDVLISLAGGVQFDIIPLAEAAL